ncbi:NAD-binding protein [Streptomyces sp. NPDC048281]|uniref:NAD-binding protein n=2 Tax=unclassified Streptomyces TaxID=2593676 RepID=UPI00341599C8
MVVCGDDGLAHRLAAELRTVYGEQVTLVVPPNVRVARPPVVGRARAASAALFDRVVSATVGRTGGNGGGAGGGGGSGGGGSVSGVGEGPRGERVLEADEAGEAVLAEAGVERAAALALVYDDDETNIRAALTARRLNPRLRLVLRLYNRRLGQHIEELLDQAAALAVGNADGGDGGDGGGAGGSVGDASTIVLSDADTAAPALAATALAGRGKVIHTDGLVLRAVDLPPGADAGQDAAERGLFPLALLSPNGTGPEPAEGGRERGPLLLPDGEQVRASAGERGVMVLEHVSSSAGAAEPAGRGVGVVPPLASLFSRRLRWSLAGIVGCVVALAVALSVVTHMHPVRAFYYTLLDLFAIDNPAIGAPLGRQLLQLLSGLVGLLLLPVLLAAVLEALGTFRTASALRKPPRGLGGHVVLLGLGKIGTRVLTRLRELHVPVVCVEADPEARGLAVARRLRVPVVLGDVTQEGVLEAAKIHRAQALLAVTSADTTNLEAVLYARSVRPDLTAVLRLYDDDFATAVYRTLRAAHPRAITRSRSVSYLAAPSFAGAMLGRQILGAIPVERKVLLVAVVEVGGHPQLEGRTVEGAFRAGAWRVLALEGRQGVAAGEYVMRGGDRVVVVATRRGLAELSGRRPSPTHPPT